MLGHRFLATCEGETLMARSVKSEVARRNYKIAMEDFTKGGAFGPVKPRYVEDPAEMEGKDKPPPAKPAPNQIASK